MVTRKQAAYQNPFQQSDNLAAFAIRESDFPFKPKPDPVSHSTPQKKQFAAKESVNLPCGPCRWPGDRVSVANWR